MTINFSQNEHSRFDFYFIFYYTFFLLAFFVRWKRVHVVDKLLDTRMKQKESHARISTIIIKNTHGRRLMHAARASASTSCHCLTLIDTLTTNLCFIIIVTHSVSVCMYAGWRGEEKQPIIVVSCIKIS